MLYNLINNEIFLNKYLYLKNLLKILIKIVRMKLTISILPRGIKMLKFFRLRLKSANVVPNHENLSPDNIKKPNNIAIKPIKISCLPTKSINYLKLY